MAYLKNGSSQNGRIHSKLSFKAPKSSQKFSTLQKIIFGENKLSKRDKLALKASKNGNFMPNICYSLNKSGRWESLGSLENVVGHIKGHDRGYPVTVVRCFNENWMKSCKRLIRVGADGGIQNFNVKSKRGSPVVTLLNQDSEIEVPKHMKERSKKRPVDERLEDEPMIMYKLNEWNSEDHEYQKSLQKIASGRKGKKIRSNKILEFDESDFLNYSDVESDPAEDDIDEEIIAPATTSRLTIGDCFVVKTPKNRKRKHTNIDYDMVEKIQKVKTATTQSPQVPDELARMGDEFISTYDLPCDIKVKGFFNFPSFISFEEFQDIQHMFDFHWLSTDGINKKCLFTIPKSDKNVISNFTSTVKLECIKMSAKKRCIRITTNAIHDFDLQSVILKKHHLSIPEKIHGVITVMYTASMSLAPFNIKPSMTVSNPSLSTSAYPLGDFELLYQCQNSSTSDSMDDFEIISLNESCNFCFKSNKNDLNTLQCGHIYCNECSTKSIKKQIRNCSEILCCEICETSFDPLFVLSSTPLMLLKYYLRFIKSADNVVCPSCQGVLKIPKDQIKAGNVQCEKCHISFCASCKDSVHFPLTCAKMKTWTSKVLQEAWFTKNGHLQCYCDTMLSIPSNLESNTELECPECLRKYSIMWENPDYYNRGNWWHINVRILPKIEDFSPNIITKRIKHICLEAHFKTANSSIHTTISKKISKLGIIDVAEAKKLYTTTLHFIEFGYAWLYLNKKSKNDKKPLIQKCLKELRGLLSEFENRDFKENDKNGCEKLEQWKVLIKKVLNYFL